MIDLAALKAELATDPVSIGYTGDDKADARLLNDLTKRNARSDVESRDLLKVVVGASVGSGGAERNSLDLMREAVLSGTVNKVAVTDEAALSHVRALWALMELGGRIDASDTKIIGALQTIGIVAGGVRTALGNLGRSKGSRAQELFGQRVTPSDIANARRLP